jgi:5'(3')-deoxyribonucleotidase
MKKNRKIFVDMDGVIVDFEGFMKVHDLTAAEVKPMPDAYLRMKPIPGAIDGVRQLIKLGFDVWIATKPPTGVAHAYAEKAQWIFNYLPELERKIIMTHDKGLLGDSFDILLDDRLHRANCADFDGHLFAVNQNNDQKWPAILNYIQANFV